MARLPAATQMVATQTVATQTCETLKVATLTVATQTDVPLPRSPPPAAPVPVAQAPVPPPQDVDDTLRKDIGNTRADFILNFANGTDGPSLKVRGLDAASHHPAICRWAESRGVFTTASRKDVKGAFLEIVRVTEQGAPAPPPAKKPRV
jgi:hypothetical protein